MKQSNLMESLIQKSKKYWSNFAKKQGLVTLDKRGEIMRIKLLLLSMVILTLIVCFLPIETGVSISAARLGDGPLRQPVPWDKVIVYQTAEQVPAKYEEVALITATGDATWTSKEQMYKKMRKKAGKLGANAIILDAMSEPNQVLQVITYFLPDVSGEREGKAVAIYVFLDKK